MKGWLTTVVLLVLLTNSLHSCAAKHQACVVSSSSITVPWVWPQVLVSVWIPPRNLSENALSTAEHILYFMIQFAKEDSTSTYDVIEVFYNNVTLTSSRNDSISKETASIILPESNLGGWLNVTFEVKESYILKRTGSNEVLVSKPLEKEYQNVQEVIISGSNITVNCESDQLIWRVAGTKEDVPLTLAGRGWRFGLYTTTETLTIVTFGDATFTLALGEQGLNANSSSPLQPFTQYQFLIECINTNSVESSAAPLICYVKSNSNVLKILEVSSRPTFLRVEGKEENPFFLFMKTIPLPVIYPEPSGSTSTVPSATIPIGVGGGSGGGSGSGSGGPVPGWSGWWVALAVILAFLLIFVIIMCFISHYHRPKIEKLDPIWYTRKMSKKYLENMNLISEASQDHLDRTPLPERRPLLARSCSIIVDMEDPNATGPLRLWNAVSSGEIEEVEQVLATMTPNPETMLEGWDTSPYEEAHRRGYSNVLKALDAFMSRPPQLPDNDLIISVMQSHARNVEAVFEAARGGQYRHGGGVDVLLRSYSLPGTVHDEHGYSLLHYAASVKLADGGPLWLAPDIRSLVENHNVYVNAVNYKGQTALHALAEKASMSDQNTCWDGKAVNVSQAWVNLASLIMRLGCDPRVPDHSNECPDEVARRNCNHPLAEELEKERAAIGPVKYSERMVRFKDFLKASKLGQVNRMQELLSEGVNVLPLGSRSDPLQEAIQEGHRDAVFLLLSAGAPVCANGLVGDTSFEAAHKTPGLPALFPALIRRAVSSRLEAELSIIRGLNEIPDVMKKGAKDVKSIIEKSGHKLSTELSKWMEKQPAEILNNFNEMLAASASLGLTVICQLMGVAGTRLNPLPNEQRPLLAALNNNHYNTVYVLCRDLKMNPFSAGCTNDKISDQLSNDLLQSELLVFEKKLRKAGLDEVTVGNLLNYANAISERGNINKPSKVFLYLLAELSLVTMLHRTRKASSDLPLDTIVHEASGSTMMHIAAAYGRINMVEYLLSEGADYSCKTTGGLNASHLAAARGHKDCMKYIIDYSGRVEECSLGILPQQILSDYEENVKSYHLDLLSVEDSNAIANAKDDYTKTKLILSSRCGKNGNPNEKLLKDEILREQRNIRELLSDDFVTLIESDTAGFLQEVYSIDSRFKGTIVARNSVVEKTEFFIPETFEYYLELEDSHALNEGSISLKKNSKSGKDWESIDSVKSSKDPELFSGSNFRHAFSRAAQEALKNFNLKSIALVPPFFSHTSTGISIHGLYRQNYRTHLVLLNISPVLKVPFPPDYPLRKRLQQRVQFSGYEHLANSDYSWAYLLNYSHKAALSVLTEDECMVLWFCLYFCKMLSSCWWLPKRHQKRIGCAWQTYPVGVDFPSSKTIVSLFFDELVESKEASWKKESVIDKVISVLRRASPIGKRKVSFLNLSTVNPPLNSVSAVIHFLENISMKNGNDVADDVQTVPRLFRMYGNQTKAISKSSLNMEME